MAKRTKRLVSDARELGRVTVRERIDRLGAGISTILQMAGAATVAYFLAVELLNHEQPIFAPLAAVISLSASRGQLWRRAIEMVLGVAIGIGVADALVFWIGRGSWQIALVAGLAMTVALFLGSGPLLVPQAGISAILVVTVDAPTEFLPSRFFDALVGGAVALLVNQLLFPLNPRSLVARAGRPVFEKLAVALEHTADALAAGDPDAARDALYQARSIDADVRAFNDALSQGHDIARLAPPRRRALDQMEIYATAATQVDLAVRNTRVLARAGISLVRDGTPAPVAVTQALRQLAAAVKALSGRLDASEHADETRRLALQAVKSATSALEAPDALALSSVIGQVRLTASDLLRASGMNLAEAQQALDETVGLVVPIDDEQPS